MSAPNGVSAFDPKAEDNAHALIASWFLGPQSENESDLKSYFEKALQCQTDARRNYHPEDGIFISPSIKAKDAYQEGVKKFNDEFILVAQQLRDYSVPFSSPRYAGHMSFETSMPAITGWLLAVLFNPNNVAFEASPFTTALEIGVGMQLCEMLGYNAAVEPKPWGHLACDGTVANMESMWATRNLKFYPLSLRAAMEDGEPLAFTTPTLTIPACAGRDIPKLFSKLSTWELLNLPPAVVLNIPTLLHQQCGVTADFLAQALNPHLIQETGKDDLMIKFNVDEPTYYVAATKHYSWPKAAALTGIGASNVINVPVDENARIRVDYLRTYLQERLRQKRAVYAVVAIVGTTEEGAVDPVDQIIALRDKFEKAGLSFVVHVDAAWGGYFASTIPRKQGRMIDRRERDYVPGFPLRQYTFNQFKALQHADSITIDPHKSGYIPYPAGGLCYKDGRMRFLVTWTAPYLSSGNTNMSIGVYGIEGSKPGAPAVATYLHHQVVGLNEKGHGALLGEVIWTSSRLSAVWATLADNVPDFYVALFNTPSEEDLSTIRAKVIGKDNETVHNDPDALEALRDFGSDLNINAFCVNFRIKNEEGVVLNNMDVEEANYFNKAIYYHLALVDEMLPVKDMEMFLSATSFEMHSYGDCCTAFKQRIGLEIESGQDLFVLRNVCMSPFQTAGEFIDKLGEIFRGVAQDKVKPVIERNTIVDMDHAFLVQYYGGGNAHLVYLPHFYNANRRAQLILTARLEAGQAATATQRSEPHKILIVPNTTLEKIVSSSSITGSFYPLGGQPVNFVELTVVKYRSLRSACRDLTYPEHVPFYLYGTPDAPFVDHILTQAPNVQITTSTSVSLALNKELTAEDLQFGTIAFLNIPESARQPPNDAAQSQGILPPGSLRFGITVYSDPRDAFASGPGLLDLGVTEPVATGTVKFASWPWVWLGLNAGREPPKRGKPDDTPRTIQELIHKYPPLAGPQSWAELEAADHPWVEALRARGFAL